MIRINCLKVMIMLVLSKKIMRAVLVAGSCSVWMVSVHAQNAPGGLQALFQQGVESSTQSLPVTTIKNNPSGQVPQNYVSPKPKSTAASAPGEFQQYVQATTGEVLIRFGSDLARDGDQTFSPPATAAIPGDYLIGPGDEVFVRTWGSLDADLRLTVDRAGQVAIPKVGTVTLTGVSHSNLNKVLLAAIGKTYSGVNVSASMGQLRGIRVYVTGYAQSPGAYTVNNLSSLINVVMAAGGPSSAGSFRNIQLKRAGKVVSTFDLYDLLLKGDKSQDRPVTAEDVIHVGPAGPQVAISGSVNKPSIFEVKKGESLQDLMTYAGGFVSGAQMDTIKYMGLRTRQQGFQALDAKSSAGKALDDGDIYLAVSDVALQQPVDKQLRMVKVDGQVNKPGIYALKPNNTLQDAIKAAGGLAPSAYLYGTRLERVSVKAAQEKNLERFKREAKRDLSADGLRKQTNAEDIALGAAAQQRGALLIAALEEIKAEGRLALNVKPQSKELPPILVESGDVLTVPAVPNSVAIMGSIAGGQIMLAYDPDQSISEYIDMAGGFSRGADTRKAYVMRANGQFVNANKGWLSSSVNVMPGDAIFVPENLQKTTFTKELKDWTSIIYQLGLGAAAIKVLQD
jgi:protein involved in polysaccharide export with SLBB domain